MLGSGHVFPLPLRIESEAQLEDLLSAPYPEDIAAARSLVGDVLILGAGGKMGPTLARRIRRALPQPHRVIAVSRFSDAAVQARLNSWGVDTIPADLLAPGALDSLPDAPYVIYAAARKFGTGGDASSTWVTNAFLPGLVARRYARSRIVSFSTGNVYPLFPTDSPGPAEDTPPAPVGEYGQSALARERVFEYFSRANDTPVALIRLNYAVELRYGVLVDLASKVAAGIPIDLSMGHVNVIWEGDANSVCLRSLAHCASPPFVLNLTGLETLQVRDLAQQFGRPVFQGSEADSALLSNAALCSRLFGPPKVPIPQVIAWVKDWITQGRVVWSKPTHFEVRDGKF
jgi:nucleoside-diphosphate-sugar epimerase